MMMRAADESVGFSVTTAPHVFSALRKLPRMKHALDLEILPQPNDSSCGPTCLAAVYHYWNDPVDLEWLIPQIGQLGTGGTLAVQLACHALRRGYDAVITTYNLQLFDPAWFKIEGGAGGASGAGRRGAVAEDADRGDGDTLQLNGHLAAKLRQQLEVKGARPDVDRERLEVATEFYLDFLALGGRLQMHPLDAELVVETLTQGVPMLCGLSATYLYQEPRERSQSPDASGRTSIPDDIGGDPVGHFVVLHGYDAQTGHVLIADPLHPNPIAPTNKYSAPLVQVTSAILLGIVTYDANVLTLIPRFDREERPE